MPLYVVVGRDGPRGLALRKLHRDAHLATLQPLVDAGRVRYAGPILGAGGDPAGSVVVFEAADRAEAEAIVARDPYVVEGIFASTELHETRQVFPEPS